MEKGLNSALAVLREELFLGPVEEPQQVIEAEHPIDGESQGKHQQQHNISPAKEEPKGSHDHQGDPSTDEEAQGPTTQHRRDRPAVQGCLSILHFFLHGFFIEPKKKPGRKARALNEMLGIRLT